MKPWQNCPPCPECSLPCGTLCRYQSLGQPDAMRCAACGHAWTEADPARIAQARAADEAWRVESARIDEVCAAQLAPYRRGVR